MGAAAQTPNLVVGGYPWIWQGDPGVIVRGPRQNITDFDIVADGSAHSVYRAPSLCNGELRWFTQSSKPRNLISFQNFNLHDAPSPLYRVICADAGQTAKVSPTSQHDLVNIVDPLGAAGGFVHSTPGTANPTDPTLDWSATFGTFGNVSTLSDHALGQMIFVAMRFNGTSGSFPTQAFTVTILDDTTPITSKTITMRLSNLDEVITMLRVSPSSFSPATMANLKVKIDADGTSTGGQYWTFRGLNWYRVKQLNGGVDEYDSGWCSLYGSPAAAFGGSANEYWRMPRVAQSGIVHPYLKETNVAAGHSGFGLMTTDVADTYVFFTHDDSVVEDTVLGGENHVHNISSWRPEIGWIDEGLGAATLDDLGNDAHQETGTLMNGWTIQPSDSSIVLDTSGESSKVIRRRVKRQFKGGIDGMSLRALADFEEYFRRVGITEPIAIAVMPGEATTRQAFSFVGRVDQGGFVAQGYQGTNPGKISTLSVSEIF